MVSEKRVEAAARAIHDASGFDPDGTGWPCEACIKRATVALAAADTWPRDFNPNEMNMQSALDSDDPGEPTSRDYGIIRESTTRPDEYVTNAVPTHRAAVLAMCDAWEHGHDDAVVDAACRDLRAWLAADAAIPTGHE